jgi:hypothetical protein
MALHTYIHTYIHTCLYQSGVSVRNSSSIHGSAVRASALLRPRAMRSRQDEDGLYVCMYMYVCMYL